VWPFSLSLKSFLDVESVEASAPTIPNEQKELRLFSLCYDITSVWHVHHLVLVLNPTNRSLEQYNSIRLNTLIQSGALQVLTRIGLLHLIATVICSIS
jgi:hypothetical protein